MTAAVDRLLRTGLIVDGGGDAERLQLHAPRAATSGHGGAMRLVTT